MILLPFIFYGAVLLLIIILDPKGDRVGILLMALMLGGVAWIGFSRFPGLFHDPYLPGAAKAKDEAEAKARAEAKPEEDKAKANAIAEAEQRRIRQEREAVNVLLHRITYVPRDFAEFIDSSVRFFREELGIVVRLSSENPLPLATKCEEGDFSSETWLEIADGPIHWIRLASGGGDNETSFYTLDPRIKSSFPLVSITPVLETGSPRFGYAKGVYGRVNGVHWTLHFDFACLEENTNAVFSKHVARGLSDDPSITRGLLSHDLLDFDLFVAAGPGYGCWAIREGDEDKAWSRPLWEHYQAIAEALLAMPIPSEE